MRLAEEDFLGCASALLFYADEYGLMNIGHLILCCMSQYLVTVSLHNKGLYNTNQKFGITKNSFKNKK